MSTLPKLRELAEAATPAPWHPINGFVKTDNLYEVVASFVNCDGDTIANRDLVCAMRNSLAPLLAVAEAAAAVQVESARSLDSDKTLAALDDLDSALAALEGLKEST